MYRYFLILTFFFAAVPTSAQSGFEDEPALEALLKRGVDYIYSGDLKRFDQVAEQVRQMKPYHPVYPLLKALAIRAANYPISVSNSDFPRMRAYLEEVIDKSEVILDEDQDEPVANFFSLAAYGLLALYENEAGNTFRAAGYAKEAYDFLKVGFDMKEQYNEFYFSSGIYNYYRVKYPELHPVYKSFTWFFRDGNLAIGLEQLDKAYLQSVFMRPESALYLMHIYLHYENLPLEALPYARQMITDYPNNPMFSIGFLEASIASELYADLSSHVKRLKNSPKLYFQMTGSLFEAMLLEKKDNRFGLAKRAYRQAIFKSRSMKSEDARHFRSYAYAGLARIAAQEEKHDDARALYEDALAEAQYPSIKAEAEAYLQ